LGWVLTRLTSIGFPVGLGLIRLIGFWPNNQMGIPAANDLTPHIEYADGSNAVEDPNGTRPNHVAPNVRSDELGIPAGN
ncbi:hypothetical protein Tco_0141572, partial [Tanacetum coccineum]